MSQPGAVLEQPAPVSQPAGQLGPGSEHPDPTSHCQSQAHESAQVLWPWQLPSPPHSARQTPPAVPQLMSALQLAVPVHDTLQSGDSSQSTAEQARVPVQITSQRPALPQAMPPLQLFSPVQLTMQVRAWPQAMGALQVAGASQCTTQSSPGGHCGNVPSGSGSISHSSPTQPRVQAAGQPIGSASAVPPLPASSGPAPAPAGVPPAAASSPIR